MEHAEMISEQWCSLSGLYTAKEADFMTQLYANSSDLGIQSAFWPPTAHESSILSVQDSKHINEIENNTDLDTCKDNAPADNMAPKECGNEILVSEQERNREKRGKRCRISNEVPKKKRNVKCKKNMRCAASSQDQALSCSDDDESNNASHQNDSASALKSSGKSRGSATDPQSLYARRRRERINERLRILQNIVPNGTKVDISTMLEEAVQYVKFLQLQIKLLSSDDMWMYAPIAYNGINIGLQLSITPTTKDPKDIHGTMA